MHNFNKETMDWALSKMDGISHLKGFPVLTPGIRSVAGALLRIAHPVVVKARLQWVASGRIGSEFCASSDLIDPGAEALEETRIIIPKIGEPVNPFVWILDYAVETYVFFPAPVELRRVVDSGYFPAADGMSPDLPVVKGGAA